MAKFEIGILVRIIDGPKFENNRECIGHIGKITKHAIDSIHGDDLWDVEGTEYVPGTGWPEYYLEPISPPKEELGNWDTVEFIIGWNPTKQRETI